MQSKKEILTAKLSTPEGSTDLQIQKSEKCPKAGLELRTLSKQTNSSEHGTSGKGTHNPFHIFNCLHMAPVAIPMHARSVSNGFPDDGPDTRSAVGTHQWQHPTHSQAMGPSVVSCCGHCNTTLHSLCLSIHGVGKGPTQRSQRAYLASALPLVARLGFSASLLLLVSCCWFLFPFLLPQHPK